MRKESRNSVENADVATSVASSEGEEEADCRDAGEMCLNGGRTLILYMMIVRQQMQVFLRERYIYMHLLRWAIQRFAFMQTFECVLTPVQFPKWPKSHLCTQPVMNSQTQTRGCW